MGVGVTPEKYRAFIEGATNQDYIVIGPKDLKDVGYIASKMSGELLEPKTIPISGLEMNVYFIKDDKVNH